MNIKCEYCGQEISDKESNCPHCGAAIANHTRTRGSQPRTIEQLQQWYKDMNLPPEEVTRFFIGKNIKEKRAFGIYLDENGEYVVYKNKDNGQRAIRYQGKDEAYAVNELYQRLKTEITNQKANNMANQNKAVKTKESRRGSIFSFLIFFGIVFLIVTIGLLCSIFPIFAEFMGSLLVGSIAFWMIYGFTWYKFDPNTFTGKKKKIYIVAGWIATVAITFSIWHYVERAEYFKYDDRVYCCYHGDYYYYTDYSYGGNYFPVYDSELVAELEANGDAYTWDPNSEWDDFVGFKNSDYYEDNIAFSSSSDSDSSWSSSDSWDSGSTDWSSDW